MVDVVGFGFRNTDYANCSTAKIIGENFDFSRTVLINYSKPTIWLYVGISRGKSLDGSCEWSDTKVHDFYQNLFAITDAMASSGIMGFSLYEFTDGRGPLDCNGVQGCNFGLMGIWGQKHPELNTWASDCQYFGTQQFRSALIFSRNGYGRQCEAWRNTDIYNTLSTEINIPSSLLPSSPVARSPRIKGAGCGEVCVSNNPIPDDAYSNDEGVDIYDNVPGVSFPSYLCSEYGDKEVYPDIDEIADDEDISSNYLRALFQYNNPVFSETEITCVNATNMSCNPDNQSMSQICSMSGIDPCPSECPQSWQKPCAFGLAQCKEYPGAYYVNTGKSVPPILKECGGASYNPFNPTMSICCGTKKFKKALEQARQFLNDNWQTLSNDSCMGGLQESDRGWAEYYIATMLYQNESFDLYGDLANFVIQRDIDSGGQCVGDEHYIRYTRQFSNYSAAVMTNYLSALSRCDSDCPGK